ncbi:MAG: Hsp20/alpha crystallin family protein [Acidiferrobacterales bacterium]
MSIRDSHSWMWGEALKLIERAERMQRQFFRLAANKGQRPIWEPPVDIFETPHHLWIMIALPGMVSAQVHVGMEAGNLIVSGERSLPSELRAATIRRLEIPYGRYERRVELPPGHYEFDYRELANGVLVMSLRKL